MPKQQQPNAQVTALLVAQDAFMDNRGRTHVIGIFDTVGTIKFPFDISFMVYCSIKGEGTHTALIKIENSLGDKIAESKPMVAEVTPQKSHQIFAGFGIGIKAPGLYKVIAYLDGIKEIEHPLFVREEQPTKTEPPIQ
ncbi:MAG: hypothetical protein A2Z29_11000 [Chloroflexi bacterium RBG_16_56_11]|nr:MAG: hypothetical protein A2Z29_11000 [Chloroflexi bacterium RBG_16_56_11]